MCRSEFADLKVWQGESPDYRMKGDGLAIGFRKAGTIGAHLLTAALSVGRLCMPKASDQPMKPTPRSNERECACRPPLPWLILFSLDLRIHA